MGIIGKPLFNNFQTIANFETVKVGSLSPKITIFTRQFEPTGSKSLILVLGLWPRLKITLFLFSKAYLDAK